MPLPLASPAGLLASPLTYSLPAQQPTFCAASNVQTMSCVEPAALPKAERLEVWNTYWTALENLAEAVAPGKTSSTRFSFVPSAEVQA